MMRLHHGEWFRSAERRPKVGSLGQRRGQLGVGRPPKVLGASLLTLREDRDEPQQLELAVLIAPAATLGRRGANRDPSEEHELSIGVDNGGTFTDCVVANGDHQRNLATALTAPGRWQKGCFKHQEQRGRRSGLAGVAAELDL
jgi:hypothetical protein